MLNDTQNIRIEDYDYELPDERIAKFPLKERDHSKLLVYRNGEMEERRFYELPEILPEDSVVVFNNTRVIQARLFFEKETGGKVEVFCLEPHEPADYERAFEQRGGCEWKCLVGNSNKWKSGRLNSTQHPNLHAERIENNGETSIVRLTWDDDEKSFAEILDECGELPIPPYLNRRTEESDKTTYQTVYSRVKGSVAAPTAGLHFTRSVMDRCREKGMELDEVTLHVGAGTFKPVKSDTIGGHAMHSEVIQVRRQTIENIRRGIGRVVAVGTTSVRTLESLYYVGVYLETHKDADPEELTVSQWTPYETECGITAERALENIIGYLDRNNLDSIVTSTRIIIAPGYDFHVVSKLITNFHQPKSTLLLLISAYLRGDWRRVYEFAMEHDFRFLSYGDSSLLIRE